MADVTDLLRSLRDRFTPLQRLGELAATGSEIPLDRELGAALIAFGEDLAEGLRRAELAR